VESVEPEVVAANAATPADVTGRHFLATPRVDLGDRDSLELERAWGVAIDDEPLPAGVVALVDPHSIAIEIPSGLSLGLHDITVTSPSQEQSTLQDALMTAR